MEISEAQKTGSRIVLKTLTISLLIMDCINLLIQTQGDFANGILFFIADHFDFRFILLLVVLYGCGYFFGRRVGRSILINNKNYLAKGVLYAFMTIAIYVAIAAICLFIPILYIIVSRGGWTPIVIEFEITWWWKAVAVVIVIVWLLSVAQIKKKTTISTNKQSHGI